MHAIHEHIDTHHVAPNYVLAKLDLTNLFSTVHRSVVFREVFHRFPVSAPVVSQTHSQPSTLHLGSTRLWSSRGVQQGDLFGLVLLALAVHPAVQTLRSPLNLWFLKDGTLAGPRETIAADLHRLEINPCKCQITHLNDQVDTSTDETRTSLAERRHSSSRDDDASPTSEASTSKDVSAGPSTDPFFSHLSYTTNKPLHLGNPNPRPWELGSPRQHQGHHRDPY